MYAAVRPAVYPCITRGSIMNAAVARSAAPALQGPGGGCSKLLQDLIHTDLSRSANPADGMIQLRPFIIMDERLTLFRTSYLHK